jgi:HEAT repeat protein
MSDEKYGAGKPFDVLNTRGLASKREYVRGLKLRADTQSLSLLVECLCDESWYLRELAEHAFLDLGEPHADVLVPLLGQGLWFTRTSASRVLGQLGFRPAVPGLFELAEDTNDTAAEAAREAIVAIGNRRGAIRIAHALHRMPPDRRRRRMDDIAGRDRVLSERLMRLMRNEDLMSAEQVDALSDDSPGVRAAEEGVEWEVLTGPPPPPKPRSGDGGGGDG